jgi:peptide/nickel transport system permease protein
MSSDLQSSSTKPDDPLEAEAMAQPIKPQRSRGYWSDVWRRYRGNLTAMLALAYVIVLSLVAILAPAIVGTKPLVAKYKGKIYFPFVGYLIPSWEDPLTIKTELRGRYSPSLMKRKDPKSWALYPLVFQDPTRRVRQGEWPNQPGNPFGDKGKPSQYNLLGTDALGYDVFAQLVHGTRLALLVGFVSTGIAATIGITLGALAGYFGGWVDVVISRIIEVMLCVPTLVLILALLAVVDRATVWHTMVVIGATSWTSIARLMRAEFLKLKTVEYVAAAKAIGASQSRVMFRHILPNALAPVLVPITFGIATAILIENGLSFLGFGSQRPNASWGTLLSSAQKNLEMWWLVIFPGIAIFTTVLAYNLIGEGLQEATDPRLRESAK